MIELFQFQAEAAAQITDRFIEYHDDPVVTGTQKSPRRIPFFQSLSSLTASGKTVILAETTTQIASALPVKPVVLWLSKATVVVEQSYMNLLPNGRYAHLIGDADVRTLAEYRAADVAEANRTAIFFATVGTFNQKDKEAGSRLIYKSDVDTADRSTWENLKQRHDSHGKSRPLIVVYDEAHNLSDQQTQLLMELAPDAFLLASATMKLPAKLGEIVDALKAGGRTDEQLVTAVDAGAVADAGLVKSELVIGGYRAPMEETVDAMLSDMAEATSDAKAYGLEGRPKAIYVCKTNMLAADSTRKDDTKRPFDQREAPPILIWRYLTERCGIDPSSIATYASLKFEKGFPAPEEFVLFGGGDKDYAAFTGGNFQHIIFNLSLQEGWDDPLVYFAYIDRSMESKVAIEQIVGRVLRQPEARHFPAERLNTAHFYVRVDHNETFRDVVDEVERKIAREAPGIKIVKVSPGKPKPTELAPKGEHYVPTTAYDQQAAVKPVGTLINDLSDYSGDSTNVHGTGYRRVSTQKIGGVAETQAEWSEYRQSTRVTARWVFEREVKRRFKGALEVASTTDAKFNARVGLGSKAFTHVVGVAHEVVDAYLANIALVQRRVDPYTVGPVLVRQEGFKKFDNAVHEGYDGLNSIENDFAAEIDNNGATWCRNPPRTGYGIPLITIGSTATFYPDFLVWHDQKVLAVDTKGGHLLKEAAGRKLLGIRRHPKVDTELVVRFISEGRYNAEVQELDKEGYTLWSRREDGTLRADHQPSMAAAVDVLLS